MMYGSEIKVQRTRFYVILGHFFCPLTLLINQKIKMLEKEKNA